MSADYYLQGILTREAVNVSAGSPVLGVQTTLMPVFQGWAGVMLRNIHPSGSFAKGTANSSGTDIDLFVSLSNNVSETLQEIHNKLFDTLQSKGYSPRRQNVSINIRVNGYSVDVVPGKHQGGVGEDHSLYRRRANTWTKTNVIIHINKVRIGGRSSEIRTIKLWRDQKGLDFPSFYLELAVMEALSGVRGSLSQNVWRVFEYLRDTFPIARFVDPANTANIISDDLSVADRAKIKNAAIQALAATDWNQIIV
jgi:hypothetical protein